MRSAPTFFLTSEDGRLIRPDEKFDFLDATLYPAKSRVELTLHLPPEYANFARVHVCFRMQMTTEDAHSAVMDCKYSNARLLHADGTNVDYGFRMHRWSRVNFDADVCTDGGVPSVRLLLTDAEGLCVHLSRPVIDTDIIPTEGLLGGAELLQTVAARRLGMCYVLTAPEGQTVMIDCGRLSKEELIGDHPQIERLLTERGGYVSDWFLTHYHGDHIGALIELLNADNTITIENLYYDFSCDPDFLARHEGAEAQLIDQLAEAIQKSGKVRHVITPKKGDVIERGGLRIKVLNDAYFQSAANLSNDSSLIFKVETPKESILFLGDMGNYGSVLLEDPEFVREIKSCMIVQMAHHGQEGVEEIFYRTLESMKICLYPAQEWLFDCNLDGQGLGSGIWESLITRSWIRELDVRKSYSMIDGEVILK